MKDAQRYYGLDFFRSLMMVLGLVLHTAQYYAVFPISPHKYKAPETSFSMDLVLITINTFRMPAFFLLAGFFFALMLSRKGINETFRNRSGRIIKPFFVYTPLLCGILAVLDLLGTNLMYGQRFGFDPHFLVLEPSSFIFTQHLWFVHYLIIYYLVAYLLLKLATNKSLRTLFWLMAELFKTAFERWFGIVFIGLLLGLFAFGLDTGRVNADNSLLPAFRNLAFFGTYFLFGVFVFLAGDTHMKFETQWGRLLTGAFGALAVALSVWQLGAEPFGLGPQMHNLILVLFNGLSAWLFALGFWGLALAAFKSYKPWVRYFTDSSYWIFLVHLPILAFFAALIHFWQAAAELKFLVVFLLGTAACVGSYAVFVRNSWIGAVLSGQRYPDVWPAVEPTSQEQTKKPAE